MFVKERSMQESAQGRLACLELEADLKLCGADRLSKIQNVIFISLEKHLPCLPSQIVFSSLASFLCPLIRFSLYILTSLLGWKLALLYWKFLSLTIVTSLSGCIEWSQRCCLPVHSDSGCCRTKKTTLNLCNLNEISIEEVYWFINNT